jgi:hypothetical protein
MLVWQELWKRLQDRHDFSCVQFVAKKAAVDATSGADVSPDSKYTKCATGNNGSWPLTVDGQTKTRAEARNKFALNPTSLGGCDQLSTWVVRRYNDERLNTKTEESKHLVYTGLTYDIQ